MFMPTHHCRMLVREGRNAYHFSDEWRHWQIFIFWESNTCALDPSEESFDFPSYKIAWVSGGKCDQSKFRNSTWWFSRRILPTLIWKIDMKYPGTCYCSANWWILASKAHLEQPATTSNNEQTRCHEKAAVARTDLTWPECVWLVWSRGALQSLAEMRLGGWLKESLTQNMDMNQPSLRQSSEK